ALQDAHARSAEAVEALAHGPGIAPALGGVHEGEGGDARAHAHSRVALVAGGGERQEARAPELHRPPAPAGQVRRRAAPARIAARARAHPELPAGTDPGGDVRALGVLSYAWRSRLSRISAPMSSTMLTSSITSR